MSVAESEVGGKSKGKICYDKILSYILLTVHPNTMTVFFYQLDAQILYFNTFIIYNLVI